MKFFALCMILSIVVSQCALAESENVGLYAPDRYDGIPEMCLMPMDFGYCRAKVKRYYFDMRRMKCAMFYWGGCAGNINNFKSIDECNKSCLDDYEADHDHVEAAVERQGLPVERQVSRNSGGYTSNNNNINKTIKTNTPTNFKVYKTSTKDNLNNNSNNNNEYDDNYNKN